MGSSWLRPAYVALGSNLDEPVRQIHRAMELLAAHPALTLVSRSRLYRSTPLGPQDQPDFVNAAVGLLTALDPHALLAELLAIERHMGRDRRERWGPRNIDLDLIWIPGERLDTPDLTLPHPGVSVRNFVLYPLNDIAPSLRIPGAGRVADLLVGIGAAGLSLVDDNRGSA